MEANARQERLGLGLRQNTTPMTVRLPTRKEKIHQKGGVEEMNHFQERLSL